MLTHTRHFCERWQSRVGTPVPAPAEIERMISNGIELQRFRIDFTPRGRRLVFLQVVWVPERDLILKIDSRKNRAVTVITEHVAEMFSG
jgi:hypothetical protein